MPQTVRIVLGVLLAAAGVVLIFSPKRVAATLSRPHETASEKINMRASWGGSLLGVGMLVAWLGALGSWKRVGLGAVLCLMLGIAFGRAVGFVLDGSPNTVQWVYLVAEILISAGCVWALWS